MESSRAKERDVFKYMPFLFDILNAGVFVGVW